MTPPSPSIRDDLRAVAATHHPGALVNAIDELGKAHGLDALPKSVRRAAVALAVMLDELGLGTGVDPLAADTWRAL